MLIHHSRNSGGFVEGMSEVKVYIFRARVLVKLRMLRRVSPFLHIATFCLNRPLKRDVR